MSHQKSHRRLTQAMGFVFALVLFCGFVRDDLVELEGMVNARRNTDSFKRGDYSNVRYTLKKGTHGGILEAVPDADDPGSFALKIEVQDGKHAGDVVWVYYNRKHPWMKLYHKGVETKDPSLAKSMTLTGDVRALASEDSAMPTIRQALSQVDAQKSLLDMDQKEDCDSQLAATPLPKLKLNWASISSRSESLLRVPQAGGNQDRLAHYGLSVDPRGNYNLQTFVPVNHVQSFSIVRADPRKASRDENGTSTTRYERVWTFYTENDSMRDLRLWVWDHDFRHESESPGTSLYFFPRRYVPAITESDGLMNVLLPNGEKVQFDAQTKKIVGGVLAEKPIDLNHAAPRISYRGNGVLLRLSGRGRMPEESGGSATISRRGFSDCVMPASEVVVRQGGIGHLRFSTDEAFNRFVSRRCGFSIW